MLSEWRGQGYPPCGREAAPPPLVQALLALPGPGGEDRRARRRGQDVVTWRIGDSPDSHAREAREELRTLQAFG
eukprot:13597249-Alexandrium_andersonii.AAC.1